MENKYYHYASSAIGISHRKSGIENQDSFKVYEDNNCLIVATADGHGGRPHFRSKSGSIFAVEVAIEKLKELAKESVFNYKRKELDERIKKLTQSILELWKEKSLNDVGLHPIEIKKIGDDQYSTDYNGVKRVMDEKGYARVTHNNLLAYGTTLIALLITDSGILIVKIGDGDVRLTYGKKSIDPFINEDILVGSSTHSLCEKHAIDNFYTYYTQKLPDSVMMVTDGVTNSFPSKYHLDELINALSEEHRTNQSTFNETLNEILASLAKEGSQDDCSLAYLLKQ